MSSCDFHANLYIGILATPIILWDLAAYKVAWDQACLNIILLFDEQVLKDYTAHHWAVATSMLTYIVARMPLACVILLIIEQLQLLCQLRVLYCSSWSSAASLLSWLKSLSCRTTCCIIAIRVVTSSPAFIILLIIEELRLPCQLPLKDYTTRHWAVAACSMSTYLDRLCCSSLSSCGFHTSLSHLYSGNPCHSHTPVGLYCLENSMRPACLFCGVIAILIKVVVL
jgi:hypothetical protein